MWEIIDKNIKLSVVILIIISYLTLFKDIEFKFSIPPDFSDRKLWDGHGFLRPISYWASQNTIGLVSTWRSSAHCYSISSEKEIKWKKKKKRKGMKWKIIFCSTKNPLELRNSLLQHQLVPAERERERWEETQKETCLLRLLARTSTPSVKPFWCASKSLYRVYIYTHTHSNTTDTVYTFRCLILWFRLYFVMQMKVVFRSNSSFYAEEGSLGWSHKDGWQCLQTSHRW